MDSKFHADLEALNWRMGCLSTHQERASNYLRKGAYPVICPTSSGKADAPPRVAQGKSGHRALHYRASLSQLNGLPEWATDGPLTLGEAAGCSDEKPRRPWCSKIFNRLALR